MSDETIQYITTDYLIEVDGGDPTPAPIEYIVELGQVGVQGIPGEKGEPGFSPTVGYILNDNTFKINITNQDGVTQTPNLYDYFADKNGYIKVDGSNANNPITLNGCAIRQYDNTTFLLNDKIRYQTNNQQLHIGDQYGDYLTFVSNSIIYNKANNHYASPNALATISDIPTVGNGTITITQGGVTKGTFTTNQSGNTTIDLDAGGGSITNPLEIVSEPYGDYNTQQKIIIKAGTGNGSLNDIELGLKPFSTSEWITTSAYLISRINNPLSISSNASGLGRTLSLNYDSNTLGLNAIDELAVKGMVGADGTNAGSAGLVPAPTATDNTKFLRGDGTWQTVGGGGSSYTAGTGIDITNDVISIDTSVVAQLSDIPDVSNFVTNSSLATTLASYVQSSSLGSAAYTASTDYATAAQGGKADTAVQPSDLATVATTGNYIDLNGRPNLNAYVTLDTTQTISGTKTFSSETHHTGVITFDSALLNPIVRGMSGSSYRNMIYRIGNSSIIIVGNSNDTIDLKGSGTRPTYNNDALALLSDIPSLTGYATITWVNSQGYLTSSDISDMATQTWVGQQGYITEITSSDVTTALGYTPYNATNPNGFISGIDSTMVVSALGYTPYADSNPDGFISGISSTDVVNALGYTPYSSSNPNGYTSVVESTVSGWGFTKNVGTVTSVNNVQPDSNGNVTVTPTITVIDGGNA